MKTNLYFLTLLSLFFMVSCKDDDPTGPIIPDPDDPVDPVFVYIDPNINDGVIDFEEFGPSFEADTKENDERDNGGNWSVFGGSETADISISYAENPDKTEPNTSDQVLKIDEPELNNEWAGFYFKLAEGMNFPEGKEAIKLDVWAPAETVVSIKLEDELVNGTDGKKVTGDIFATKQNDGWETLVFNIPEGKDEDGVYNTFVIIMTRYVTAAGISYLDNIDYSTPAEVIIPDAPTTAPSAPTYSASEVISIFSDEYTSPEGLNLNPNWGQGTEVTEETIADNTVLKMASLDYQGIEITPALDLSAKTKLHLDYFTGDSTNLSFFLISPGPQEKGYELDVTTTPGEWNSIDIDLSHFSDVVDLSDVFQLKVVGNGTVYFDNIFFFGGGAMSGTQFSPSYTGAFGNVAPPTDNEFIFGSTGTESWAGWANEAAGADLSFPNGGKVTFTASSAAAANLYFKFENDAYPNVDPNFSSAEVTVDGAATEYTVYLQPQPAANSYKSLLFYLVTQDVAVTLTDVVITAFDSLPSGVNFSPSYTGAFGNVAPPTDNEFIFGSTGTESWAGWANEAAGADLSFPNGGKVTFTASSAAAANLYFKFENDAYPNVDPNFSSAEVTVDGAATEYTVYLQPQPAANSYKSLLFYLVTQDVAVTMTDVVVTVFE